MKASKDVSEAPLCVEKTLDGIMVVTPHHQRNCFLNYLTGPFADLRVLVERIQGSSHFPVIKEIPNIETTVWEIALVLHRSLEEPTDTISHILDVAHINNIRNLNFMSPALIYLTL